LGARAGYLGLGCRLGFFSRRKRQAWKKSQALRIPGAAVFKGPVVYFNCASENFSLDRTIIYFSIFKNAKIDNGTTDLKSGLLRQGHEGFSSFLATPPLSPKKTGTK